MSRRVCSPEQQANCPLREHFADLHHLAYPKRHYHGIGREWRELPSNKRFVCRALHNAIHASGYVPEKPSRAQMERDVAIGYVATAAMEYQEQLEVAADHLITQSERKRSA